MTATVADSSLRREVSRYHYTGTLLVRDETVYISYEEEMEGDRYRS